MNVRPLSDFIDIHRGRAALVMGGGPSMPAQLGREPEGSVYISANQHGCLLRPCDYIVALDHWGPKRRFRHPDGRELLLHELGAPVISVKREDAQIRIFEKPTANSGVVAAWVAWVMGCAPILLGGMDCYASGTYFHDAKALSSGTAVHVEGHLSRWQKLLQWAPDGMFRALGGPLTQLFREYDPAEPVEPIAARTGPLPGTAGHRIVLTKSIFLGRVRVPSGVELEMSAGELRAAHREHAVAKPQKVAA